MSLLCMSWRRPLAAADPWAAPVSGQWPSAPPAEHETGPCGQSQAAGVERQAALADHAGQPGRPPGQAIEPGHSASTARSDRLTATIRVSRASKRAKPKTSPAAIRVR